MTVREGADVFKDPSDFTFKGQVNALRSFPDGDPQPLQRHT